MEEKPPKFPIPNFLKSSTFWAVIMALSLALGLVLDWRWLRGTDEFRWGYYGLPGMDQRLWLTALIGALIGLLCYSVILWAMKRESRGQTWIILGLLFLSAVALQTAVLRLEHPDPIATVFYRTVSTRNLGAFYFDSTTTTDIQERLRRFPELMPDFHSLSPRTHPPGLQVLFWSAGSFLEKVPFLADWIGPGLRRYLCNDPAASPIFFYPNAVLGAASLQILMPLWGALSIVPFYGLARLLFKRETAVRGVVLIILAPAMVLFAAHWAHFYTLLALCALYFLYLGLLRGRWWPVLAAGVLVSSASFLSFSNLALVALLGITIAVYWAGAALSGGRPFREYFRGNLRPFMAHLAAFAAGVLSVWIVYYLVYGVSFLAVYRQGLLSHTKITGYRTYWIWLGYNLFDFFLFLGIPTFLALIVLVYRQFSRQAISARFAPQMIPFYSFAITLLALNLSGVSKGEVGRLWMFLMPVAGLAVLPVIAGWTKRQTAVAVGVLVFQLLFMGTYIRTIGSTNYPYYVPRVQETAVTAGVQQTAVEFSAEETLILSGTSISPQSPKPGEMLDVTLYWQAERPLQHSYTVFVHLVDPQSGEIVAQHDSLPRQGLLPTLCWQAGEVVGDLHPLVLDPALPAGDYVLQMGVYRLDLLQAGNPDHRLATVVDGQARTVLDLGRVRVENQ
jgi:hypothetical protein